MIALSDGLLVEDFPVTLISPKAMFRNEGIRTYFNDDLFFKTPRGMIFDFVEMPNLYILPFEPDSLLDEIDYSKILAFSSQITSDEDRLISRLMHFSANRIKLSAQDLTDLDVDKIRRNNHTETRVQRKHSARERQFSQYTFFGECVASDTIEFEVSTPFSFRYMVTFLDLATKYLACYFLRTHEMVEVRNAYNQYIADHSRFMKNGKVGLWFMDNGTEFGRPQFFATT